MSSTSPLPPKLLQASDDLEAESQGLHLRIGDQETYDIQTFVTEGPNGNETRTRLVPGNNNSPSTRFVSLQWPLECPTFENVKSLGLSPSVTHFPLDSPDLCENLVELRARFHLPNGCDLGKLKSLGYLKISGFLFKCDTRCPPSLTRLEVDSQRELRIPASMYPLPDSLTELSRPFYIPKKDNGESSARNFITTLPSTVQRLAIDMKRTDWEVFELIVSSLPALKYLHVLGHGRISTPNLVQLFERMPTDFELVTSPNSGVRFENIALLASTAGISYKSIILDSGRS